MVIRAVTCKPNICGDYTISSTCPHLWYVFNESISRFCPQDINPCFTETCLKNGHRCRKNVTDFNYLTMCPSVTPSHSEKICRTEIPRGMKIRVITALLPLIK